MKTAAVFFADGFEDIEALSPVDYLRRAGVEVITVGVKGMPFNDTMIVTSSHNVPMIMDMSLDTYMKKFGASIPDCVVCPGGGKGAINLSKCPALLEHLEKAWDAGRLVAAICAAPALVLTSAGIEKDKVITSYPGEEFENMLEEANYTDELVVVNGNLITSRGPATALLFAYKILDVLGINSDALKDGMLWNLVENEN